MSARDESRRLEVGAGSPAAPDPATDGSATADVDEPLVGDATTGPAVGDDVAGAPASDHPVPPPGDVVRAVAAFVDDLVEEVGVGEPDGDRA